MKQVINLYIYSSFHIALCASAFTASTYLLSNESIDLIYTFFIGSSTWLLYSLHRIIGINKVNPNILDNRFNLIRKYRKHLMLYAGFAAISTTILFFYLSNSIKLCLLIPSAISFLYILPIFFKKKRLRDFNYIKIFLVAICWAILCGFIPLINLGLSPKELLLFVLEKACFIFAITLPFDYRDIKVDSISNVKTLAHTFKKHFPLLITLSFLISLIVMFINPAYILGSKIYYGISYTILLMICLAFYKKENDLYISGILDGTMIIYFFMVIIHQVIFHLPIGYIL